MEERERGGMLSQTQECLEPQKLEEASMDSPLEPQRECGYADTLISDSWPPELGDNKVLLF